MRFSDDLPSPVPEPRRVATARHWLWGLALAATVVFLVLVFAGGPTGLGVYERVVAALAAIGTAVLGVLLKRVR